MKNLLALTALLLGTAGLAGPANNSLIIGTSQEPPNVFDPWVTNNMAIATEINQWLVAPLMTLDNDGKPVADLATQVPTKANGGYKEVVKDGKVVSNSMTFSIRPEANWSDGKPITVADFEFWLKVWNDERVPVPDRYPWDKAKITKINDKSFTITFTPPYLFASLAGVPGYAPVHAMKADWDVFDKATAGKKGGDDVLAEFNKFLGKFTSSKNPPKVNAGPFKVDKWSKGSSLTLVRNPNYWRKPEGGEDKYLKSVTYRFISNTNTLKVNILSGQLDAVAATGLTFDQALDLKKREGGKFTTFFVPGAVWEHIDVNGRGQKAKDLGLNDPKIRQALLLSIDRPSLVKALFDSKQPVSNTFVHPLAAVSSKTAPAYPFDQAKAKQILADAGWKAGADGILEKNGKKFSLIFSTTASNTVRERVQQILQQQWKQVGIQVNIQNYPSATFFSKEILYNGEAGKWDLAMYAWISQPLIEQGDLFKGDGIPSAANGFSGQNNPGWKNDEYDKLHKASQTEFNTANRIKNFEKMQQIWGTELPSLPLYFRSNPYTRANGLVNYTFSAYSTYPSWDAYRIGWSSRGAVEAHKQQE